MIIPHPNEEPNDGNKHKISQAPISTSCIHGDSTMPSLSQNDPHSIHIPASDIGLIKNLCKTYKHYMYCNIKAWSRRCSEIDLLS